MNVEHQSALPHGLAGVLNKPDEQRDSAYYSNMDPSSKHNSAHGHSILTPPPSNYQSSLADHTPSPINTSILNQPLPSPGSGSMSVASMVSPTTDQSMLRRLDRQPDRQSYASSNFTNEGHNHFEGESSRRQSVNSTLGPGLQEMKLGGSSPYHSNNQSTTSIQSTLQQQRNPGGAERNSLGRFYSNGPVTSQRTSAPISLPDPISPRGPRAPIIAPAITGPAQGNIARAPEAIPGQAWAFPEEPIQQLNSRARPSAESLNRNGTSFLDSRRSSLADSIASSQFTHESRYPQGQRRLDDNAGAHDYQQRLSRASSEFQGVSTHHHSLQHKQVSDLHSDAGSPNGSQPYSRTPELRVSHKLAERKRRTEMKDLFDQLRDLMPQERGSKASKWEILTKAINEYGRMKDTIEKERSKASNLTKEREALLRENASYRMENAQLRAENSRMGGSAPYRGEQVIREHEHIMETSQPHFQTSAGRVPQPELPPLRMPPAPPADSMNGIQYQNNRGNGYRQF
ncbi:hypothetical protein BJ878DRAFT_479127 [Calycina marina]|uniref:BHLH domain-containing protein n=1 Tax=Calycina marina TaxID=1763456 RepID=A0A9P7Z566_9HELO|nr:hypothetical protein BJ878DRAFT_479127 [Calycina marina]